jgi:hypothetical protein
MSLIPSESYSFPDHFTRTVTPSRRPKEGKPQAAAVDKPRNRPAIVALPDPLPVPEPEIISEEPAVEPPPVIEPVRSKIAPPNPAIRRATAPPPRIPETVRRIPLPPTLKPKVRWNNRGAPMDPPPIRNNGNGTPRVVPETPPAQNVIPMKMVKVARPLCPAPSPALAMQQPVQAPPPKPVPVTTETRRAQRQQPLPQKLRPAVVPNPQADFFEMFTDDGQTAAMKRRRTMKFRRFIACEAAALAVLLPLVIFGLTLNITAPELRWMINIFTIAAAVAAAVIPIVFYAFTPTLPELER